MAEDKLPGVMDLTPFNPVFNDDPHVLLDKLRSACPVYRDTAAGSFVLTSYEDVRAVLSDTTMWRHPERTEQAAVLSRAGLQPAPPGLTIPEAERGAGILFMDEPDHMRVRAPLAKALYKRVAKSRPLVQQVVDEWLDRVADKGSLDVMGDFATRVPVDVIARTLGVDPARLAEFREWSEGAILGLYPFRSEAETQGYVHARNCLSEYTRELMAARRGKPEDDLTSDMVALQAEGAELSDSELSTNLQGLLIAGSLTTTDLIGNAIWLFLTHPEELAKLKADPSLIGSAVEEALRIECPVDLTSRIAPREMEVGGCPVHPTQSMLLHLRAANHDPKVFPDPRRFDIARKDAPHVAFGGGLHLCIGAPLGRLMGQVAIMTFFERFPNARLANPDEKPHWATLPLFRGFKTLKVAI